MFIIFLLIFNYWSGTVCSVFRIWNLNLRTFVAKYWRGDLRTFWRKILKARFTRICRETFTPGFTHFFRNFFLTEKAVSQTFSLLECMQATDWKNYRWRLHCEHPCHWKLPLWLVGKETKQAHPFSFPLSRTTVWRLLLSSEKWVHNPHWTSSWTFRSRS